MHRLIGIICMLVVFTGTTTAQERKPELNFFGSHNSSAEMRKYNGENPFEKGFSWDAHLAQHTRFIQYGSNELWGSARFQSVIAQSYDKKIRVSGEIYMIGGTYRYAIDTEWTGAVSLSHISTHVTQDLLNPFYADIPELPEGLLSDVNVLSFGLSRTSTWDGSLPVTIEIAYQPLDVMIPDVGENSRYVRPYYFGMKSAVWRVFPWQVSVLMQSEFGAGRKSIGKFEAEFEILTRAQKEPRFQMFFQRFFYGSDIGSSPRFGFFPAEFALGWRYIFSQ